MKSIIPLVVIVILSAMLTSGCKKKGCTDPDAINYSSEAKKNDGSCEYPADAFVGTYSVNESCTQLGTDTYIISIAKTGNTTVSVSGILGGSAYMQGTITDNTIFIPAQIAVPDATSYLWDMDDGITGIINGNTLTLYLTMDDILYDNYFGYVDCTLTCTK